MNTFHNKFMTQWKYLELDQTIQGTVLDYLSNEYILNGKLFVNKNSLKPYNTAISLLKNFEIWRLHQYQINR